MRTLYIRYRNKKTGNTSQVSYNLNKSQEWRPIVYAMRGKKIKIISIWIVEGKSEK